MDGAIARSRADAPEIDGMVYIEDGANLSPGEFAEGHVTAADEYDLHASNNWRRPLRMSWRSTT